MAGFILFGALQIVIGLACAMFTLYIAAGSEIAVRQSAGGGAAVASGLIVYGVATVYFVSVGVGSMRRRRWAQALSVVVSAMWLAGGAVGTLLILVMLPTIEQRTPNTSGASVLGGTDRRRNPRAARDLFVSIGNRRCARRVRPLTSRAGPIVCRCRSSPSSSFSDSVRWRCWRICRIRSSRFSAEASGALCPLTLLALGILSAWLAVQFYRLKESAWWTLVLLQVIGCVTATISLVRGVHGSGGMRSPFFIAIVVASWLAYFAYLLFIRRYFALQIEPRTRRDDAPHRVT